MEGAGIFTLLALLVAAPFEWWQRRAQKRRLLSPHELMLRRASQPVGMLAVALVVMLALYGVGGTAAALGALVLDPSTTWPAAVVLCVALAFGVASFISGAQRCRGMRDGILATRAFFRIAIGAVIVIYLGRLWPWPVPSVWVFFAVAALFLVGVWCLVVAGVRFLLLMIGGGSALGGITRLIRQRNAPMRAARASRRG